MRRLLPSYICLAITLYVTSIVQAYNVPNNRVTCWTEPFGDSNVASYIDSSLEIHEPGSCKIEINSQKASGINVLESNHKTHIYCKSYSSGAPYFDRFDQHFILVIYTSSGFISKTRLVQNRDKRILAEGEIDIDELDFDFNKYSHENIYFKIFLESFDGLDNGINSEDSNEFGEGTDNEFSSEEFKDTNTVTGDYLKTFINKQFNIDSINDLASSTDPVCSGQVSMSSINDNIFTSDHLASEFKETNGTSESMNYIGNGFFLSISSTTDNRLFYSNPYGSKSFTGQISDDFATFKNGLQEMKFDQETGNKITDLSKVSMIVADNTADYSIRSQGSLKMLAITEDSSSGKGLLEYDLETQTWTSVADENIIDAANTEFIPMSQADSDFFDRVNSPVRFMIDTSSKTLFVYEYVKNDVTSFDLATLFSLSDDIEAISASILDGIVTIATKNSGTDDITFTQYYVNLNDGTITAMYPSAVLNVISSASGYTISHMRYMSPTLLVAIDTNGKLYFSNDHGLHFKEVNMSTYVSSQASLPFSNIIINPDSNDVLYLLDQNNEVFFWRENLEYVISTNFVLPNTCSSNVILDTKSQAKVFCQTLFTGEDQNTPSGYNDNYQFYWDISSSKELLNEDFIYQDTDELSNKVDSCNIDSSSIIQDSYLKEDMSLLASDLFLSPKNSENTFDPSMANLGFKIHTELVSKDQILPQYSFYQSYGAKQAGININSYISYRDNVAYRASRSSMTASIDIPNEYSLNNNTYQPVIVYKAVNVNANLLCKQRSYRVVIKNTKKSTFNHPALYDTSYDRIGHVSYSQSSQIDTAAEWNDNPNLIDGLRPIDFINPNHMDQKYLKSLEAGYQPPSLYGIKSATSNNFYNSESSSDISSGVFSKVPEGSKMTYKLKSQWEQDADLSCSVDTQEKQLSENPNYNHCREKTFTKAFFMEYSEDKNCMKIPVEMRDLATGDFQALSDHYLVYIREINNRQPNIEWDINNDSSDLNELITGARLIPSFLKSIFLWILNFFGKLWWMNWLPRLIVKSNNYQSCSYSDSTGILQSHIDAHPDIRTNATATRFQAHYDSQTYRDQFIDMANKDVAVRDDQIFMANDLKVKLLQPGLYHFEILMLNIYDSNAPIETLYSQVYKRQQESKQFWKQGPGYFGTLYCQLFAHFVFICFIFIFFIRQTFYDPNSEHKVVIDDDIKSNNDEDDEENNKVAEIEEEFTEEGFVQQIEEDYDAKLARTNESGGKPMSAKHGMARIQGHDNV